MNPNTDDISGRVEPIRDHIWEDRRETRTHKFRRLSWKYFRFSFPASMRNRTNGALKIDLVSNYAIG